MKISKIALLLSIILVFTLTFSSCGEEKGTEGLEFYPFPDGTYGVKAGTALYLDKIVIPAEYNGKPVTQILPEAFNGAKNLTEIVIPNSVTNIETSAFSGCSSLTSIVIPDSVTSIGNYAFSGCSSLTSVVIPDSVTYIGYGAFMGCSSLTNVVIGNGVNHIGEIAFYMCKNLTSVEFKDPYCWVEDRSHPILTIDLANPNTAAQYLTSTYLYHTWTKK